MAGDTDFIALYHELGLNPDCSLEELKQAYRKRVAVLHPDRSAGQVRAAGNLQRLNTQFAAAMEFQRRHGRLPGATQNSGAEPPLHAATAAPASTPAPGMGGPRHSRLRTRIPLAIVLLVILGLWVFAQFVPSEADNRGNLESMDATAVVAPPARANPVQVIKLGSSAQQVREIHGAPVSGWEKRWEYGPSWIAFQCGIVVDWYSSPLRPLKVETEHPAASAQWSPPRHCKE